MPNPEENSPVWNSTKTRRLANQMDTDAEAHEADAMRRAADGWTEGAKKAERWARMKRRAATLLHESAEATAGREQARREAARKDVQRYELRDTDPADLMPTHLGGSFPEVYECKACGAVAVVTEQIACTDAGGTDLNAGFRAVYGAGWRPIVPRGVLCPSCVDACTQDNQHARPDLFK